MNVKSRFPPYVGLVIFGLLALQILFGQAIKREVQLYRLKKAWAAAPQSDKSAVLLNPKFKGMVHALTRLKRSDLIAILGEPNTSLGNTNVQYRWTTSKGVLSLTVDYWETGEARRSESVGY